MRNLVNGEEPVILKTALSLLQGGKAGLIPKKFRMGAI
jgi:hypothetical protein